jgi:hypothetical protein
LLDRRTFLSSSLLAGVGLAFPRTTPLGAQPRAQSTLLDRFPDLSRHFIFEY